MRISAKMEALVSKPSSYKKKKKTRQRVEVNVLSRSKFAFAMEETKRCTFHVDGEETIQCCMDAGNLLSIICAKQHGKSISKTRHFVWTSTAEGRNVFYSLLPNL